MCHNSFAKTITSVSTGEKVKFSHSSGRNLTNKTTSWNVWSYLTGFSSEMSEPRLITVASKDLWKKVDFL